MLYSSRTAVPADGLRDLRGAPAGCISTVRLLARATCHTETVALHQGPLRPEDLTLATELYALYACQHTFRTAHTTSPPIAIVYVERVLVSRGRHQGDSAKKGIDRTGRAHARPVF